MQNNSNQDRIDDVFEPLRMSLAPRPAALGAEACYLAERLRAFRERIARATTDEESWRIVRAADALDAVASRLAGGVEES